MFAMHFLNDQDRAKLRVQHKQERDKRVADRIKAVLLYDRGWSTQQIAEAQFISDQAIRDHIEDYKAVKKLAPESGGSEEKLSKEQSAQLESHLREHTYLYVKDIIEYVRVTFGVVYTVPGLRTWLQRHEFSYKKPAIVPGIHIVTQKLEFWQSWRSEFESSIAGAEAAPVQAQVRWRRIQSQGCRQS